MRIAIIGAMDEEIQHILDGMNKYEQQRKAGISFYIGTFNDYEIVLCKSGVGKVNASVCTQILIDEFEASHIIFTGVAGAVNPDLKIGDIVVSIDCLQHDMDATALGFKLGEIPYSEVSVFKADSKLVDLAISASKETVQGKKIMSGRILSGDQFIADREKVKFLHEELQGYCTEMEGAAVGQVCSMNAIPFVIIRSMSDQADGSADVNFMEFTKLASQNSYEIVNEMIKNWNVS
ncbi:MAG TPA: 5'-methylthioadenosine/adenosylhomocysteine nucleosidase [Bacillus bacterium]|nr:5'-methylthioadenosine/adenosylhomocysteine nucleosidase [Bacillus sp. (in: firmicutes)]